MGAIVCATRGGQASHAAQERAVALAQERDAELIFLCVVDPSFAEPMDEALVCALNDELKRLGRSLLCIAQARAQERGIDAQTMIRSGPVSENIKAALRELDADMLVIGAPQTDATEEAFGSENVHQLAEEIRQAAGVDVVT